MKLSKERISLLSLLAKEPMRQASAIMNLLTSLKIFVPNTDTTLNQDLNLEILL